MTAEAIRRLSVHDRFFLQVEGGRIDHALHANQLQRAAIETAAFEKAVQVALDSLSLDDSLILDSEYTSRFTPLWRALTEGRVGTDPLFRFKQEGYSKLVKEAFVAVGGAALGPVAYSCRHGGPAWDRYRKYRTVAEVKSRGRWLSDRSLRRYEKHSKMAQAMSRIGRKWQLYHAVCAAHLADILIGRRAPPVAP